jgi:replicative superfamily II helicase
LIKLKGTLTFSCKCSRRSIKGGKQTNCLALDKHLFLDSLNYRIGVHHGALDKNHKQTVESKFRSRQLDVVVATGTLAMGVHMPCKTVVFAGDAFFLDQSAQNI